MIRIEVADGWILADHQEHARLAGKFAQAWMEGPFPVPEPFEDILVGVSRHDDAWVERDANPCLTKDGLPSAFSKELVGTYDAFEEIDLADYLAIRANATEAVAGDNPFGATLVSMHTVNLLTEQADLSGLSEADRQLHSEFIDSQRQRQSELIDSCLKGGMNPGHLTPENLAWAFRFLQACDSLSLITCVQFSERSNLRHEHPDDQGNQISIEVEPLGGGKFQLDPWPFQRESLTFSVPVRQIRQKTFSGENEFRKLVGQTASMPYYIELVAAN